MKPQDTNSHRSIDQAIGVYRTLILQNPNSANLHFLLGKALMEKGGVDGEAISSLQRSITLDSSNAEAHARLGHLFVKHYKLVEGVAALRRSVQLMPQGGRLYFYLFQALHKVGRLAEAVESLKQAVALSPGDLEVHTALLGTMLYVPGYSREQMLLDRTVLGQCLKAESDTNWTSFSSALSDTKRLQVGFVSADLGSHPVGFFLDGVLNGLRELNTVDIVIYTMNEMRSAITDRIRASAHQWVSIGALSDDLLAQRIRADKIDILVDLSGHTALNRLSAFARKPAPIQVTWLGDCATTGLSAIDYILCDEYGVHVGEEQYYVEKPWRLPNTRLCFTPPTEQVPIHPLPALKAGYITFGCFNSIIKLNDSVIALWAKILARIPSSRLMLKSLSFYDLKICDEMRARFAMHGIDSARVVLTLGKSRAEYFADYNLVDIALDPFPFTGGTTTIDGLWMGVPLITLQGHTMGARQGEGILHNLGMTDWIATDMDEYVKLAVGKSLDISSLVALRAQLRSKLIESPLCNSKMFAENLASAFQQMWKRFCEGA